ncbi:hypothetical protein OH764_26535 [Burkholderia sp. M6-3]
MTDRRFHAETTPADGQLHGATDTSDDINQILQLAREAGMLVTLDGQIGRQKYQSVAGSLKAFQRFAQALREIATHPSAH